MAQGKRKIRGQREAQASTMEAGALTLLQPRKATPCATPEEYLSAPTLPGFAYEQIFAMSQEARNTLKRQQEKSYGRPWEELAADPKLGAFAIKSKRRK